MIEGYIYCFSNPSMPGILKIGMTERTPKKRLNEANASDTWRPPTKYNIEFDTLVLDCEGAFYYILMDMPEILNNIKLIIMENDYYDISKKNYVDEILMKNNFYVDYQESGGWGPCFNNFFEVWKKSVF